MSERSRPPEKRNGGPAARAPRPSLKESVSGLAFLFFLARPLACATGLGAALALALAIVLSLGGSAAALAFAVVLAFATVFFHFRFGSFLAGILGLVGAGVLRKSAGSGYKSRQCSSHQQCSH